jgi:hypothetical protein
MTQHSINGKDDLASIDLLLYFVMQTGFVRASSLENERKHIRDQ